MASWGYTIHIDNQIDYDKSSKILYKNILDEEPSLSWCIACGSCAGTCSAANFTLFSLRKLNLFIARGEIKEVKREISKCMFCGKCSLVCPRGVNTRGIIMALKKAISDQ